MSIRTNYWRILGVILAAFMIIAALLLMAGWSGGGVTSSFQLDGQRTSMG